MLRDFERKAIKKLKEIPRGRVTTYAILAKALGRPRAARAIANAIAKNPDAPKVPCHRVVRSDGQTGGYSGPGGSKGKINLLKSEGILIKNAKVENLAKILYNFND